MNIELKSENIINIIEYMNELFNKYLSYYHYLRHKNFDMNKSIKYISLSKYNSNTLFTTLKPKNKDFK